MEKLIEQFGEGAACAALYLPVIVLMSGVLMFFSST